MPKKPQDHKTAKHPKTEKWTTEVDGVEVTLPYMENLPAHIIVDGLQDDGGMDPRALMRFVFDENPEAAKTLTFQELQDVLVAWEADSSVDSGN